MPPGLIPPPSLTALLADFESLGDNCEFGLFLRSFGIEQIGLFRFGFVSLHPLLALLAGRFAGVGDDGALEVLAGNAGEYMVRLRQGGFTYHTRRLVGTVEPERLATEETLKLRLLRRKLIEDLEEGEKIFVRKGQGARVPAEIAALHGALRRYGPVTLLTILPADPAHPAGSVERLGDGVLRGYLSHYAPYHDVRRFAAADWAAICAAAHALRHAGATAAAPAAGPPERPDLLAGLAPVAPRRPRGHAADPARTPPPLIPGQPVRRHTLALAGPAGVLTWQPGLLRPGEPLSASCAVWLPDGFRGRNVVLALPGLPRIAVIPVNVSLTAQWQWIFLSARFSGATVMVELSLVAAGEPGAVFFSTAWRLERGSLPARIRTPPAVPGGKAAPALLDCLPPPGR